MIFEDDLTKTYALYTHAGGLRLSTGSAPSEVRLQISRSIRRIRWISISRLDILLYPVYPLDVEIALQLQKVKNAKTTPLMPQIAGTNSSLILIGSSDPAIESVLTQRPQTSRQARRKTQPRIPRRQSSAIMDLSYLSTDRFWTKISTANPKVAFLPLRAHLFVWGKRFYIQSHKFFAMQNICGSDTKKIFGAKFQVQ